MILVIDNYDSFSYNLYQLIGSINPDVKVIRNDELSLAEIEALEPEAIILSPGPGRPANSGVCVEIPRYFAGNVPILGVCLGHQSICEAFGAAVSYAKELMHGKQSQIKVDTTCSLFAGLPETIVGARYHSLAVLKETLPEELRVVARTKDGEIMAVKHKDSEVYGVQFHPESILTPQGRKMLENFLRRKKTMIKEAIHKLMNGENLDFDTAKAVIGEMMDGSATAAQMGAFLSALRMKGESIEEITGSAVAMREKAVSLKHDLEVMDIVGTGGDEVGTFNISTTTAFIVSAGGVPVAKHGNRSVSSKSGAADVLEKLGINIMISSDQSIKILQEIGLCFMFAQTYHSSMKHCAPVRKEMGVRTIFNILGPLANPARAKMQLMGVYDEKLVEPLAQVLSNLGVKRGMVVYGCDGLDEITLTTKTKVCEINNGELKSYYIDPQDFGLSYCSLSDLIGGNPEENAQITRRILSSLEQGPKRDVVVLNAAVCLYLGRKADTIESAFSLAQELIDSGAALKKLDEFIKLTQEVH